MKTTTSILTCLVGALLGLPARADTMLPGFFTEGGPNGADGAVLCTTNWNPDPLNQIEGKLVVAGTFSSIEGVPAGNIAMRDPDTGHWQALGSGVLGQPTTMETYNGDLIVAGAIQQAGGQPVNNIARWDGNAWHPLGSGIGGGTVRCLYVFNGSLLAGGNFTSAGGLTAHGIARWNGTTWAPFGPPIPTMSVGAMTTYFGELVIGTREASAPVGPVAGLLRWSGTTWLDAGGGLVGWVADLQVVGGTLFIALNNGAACSLITWNGVWWTTSGPWANARFEDLALYGGSLVAGGQFSPGAASVWRWNGSARVSIGGFATDGPVNSLAVWKGGLIGGGAFSSAGGYAAYNLARWNGQNWGSFGSGTVARVRATTTHGSWVVVGGDFRQTASNGDAIFHIAAWDGSQLVALGSGMNDEVWALKSLPDPQNPAVDQLIAGGSFTSAGGVPATKIARYRTDPLTGVARWERMDEGFVFGVKAIEEHQGTLYAGGFGMFAMWNGFQWYPLVSGISLQGSVLALRSFNGSLYVGGDFPSFNNGNAGLAVWTGGGTAPSLSFQEPVHALEIHDSKLVVGHDTFGGSFTNGIFAWDGSQKIPFGSGTNGGVLALRSIGDRLYAGGNFTSAGGVAAGRLAYWDNALSAWTGISGVDQNVLAITSTATGVHAVGEFDQLAGGQGPSPGWARIVPGESPTAIPVPRETTIFEALMPNPSGGPTQIVFALDRASSVRLTVHDVRGRVVRKHELGTAQPGRHQTRWDGVDDHGRAVAAGVYFVRLLADEREVGVKRLTVVH